ncbi:MAG: sel1 repeat family protein [Deltaproteobacteria bacterium]|jgi:TPR repeat protein|nr:sel1 repeat family protein [Deltaproteobacteria bacterium]
MRLIASICLITAGLILSPVSLTQAAPPAETEKGSSLAPLIPAEPEVDLKSLEKQAEAGDAAAQFQLAIRLLDIYNEPKKVNDKQVEVFLESLMWLRRSADQGYPQAMIEMGDLFEIGAKELAESFGVGGKEIGEFYKIDGQELDLTESKAEARKWYKRAADKGEIEAMLRWATLCATGEGGPQDLAAAQKMIQMAQDKAVSQKDPYALTRLAEIFENGKIVPQDLALSARLWGQAAELGDAWAKARYERILKDSPGRLQGQGQK